MNQKTIMSELCRNLAYEKCLNCGKHYAVNPLCDHCVFVDHVEAYAALDAADDVDGVDSYIDKVLDYASRSARGEENER